jgi:hypothetical protein
MPFDNIKTRMQSVDNKYKNMLECSGHMLRQKGVKVFWRATTPRLVRLTVKDTPPLHEWPRLTRVLAFERNHVHRF